jgi:hypothetical protein
MVPQKVCYLRGGSLNTLNDGQEIVFDIPLAKQLDIPLAKQTTIGNDETSHSLKKLKDGHEVVFNIPLAKQPMIESSESTHINVEICDSSEHLKTLGDRWSRTRLQYSSG